MTGRASKMIFCTLLSLLIGCSSQFVQQQYFPWGRFIGRQWTLVTKTQPLDGQPTGLLVTRNREGFLAYDQNQQTSGDTNRIPVWITVVDHPTGIPEDENEVGITDQTSSTGDELSKPYDPVAVDAEEGNFNNNKRKKRDFSSWEIFNRLSPGKFFADRTARDIKATRGLGNYRAKRSERRGPSKGIMEKRIIPLAEEVDESRYRRGTDDNLTKWRFHFRSPRDAEPKEPKITSWSTSGAGVEGRRRRRDTHMSFGFPILTQWFKL